MATTTNYSWTTPDDTDLVKDGAAAIRTLGSSIDTTTKALNPSTTLGDIEYRSSTANTNTRLGIGTTGQVLTVAAGVPSWAAVSAGGMTLLSTTTLSGTTTTVSGIDQTYTNLMFIVQGAVFSTGASVILLQPNGSGTTSWMSRTQDDQGSPSVQGAGSYMQTPSTGMKHTGGINILIGIVYNYASSTYQKAVQFTGGGDTAASVSSCNGGGWFRSSSAVTSVAVTTADGRTFSAGELLIYGVK